MDWAELRHWPGNLSVITPRRGGTEHGFFREGGLWPRSPRNFATEPAILYDFPLIFNEQLNLLHSYRIAGRFRLISIPSQNLFIFGGGTSTPVSIAVNSGLFISCTSRLLRTSSLEHVTAISSPLVLGVWYDFDVFFRDNHMVLKIGDSEYLSPAGYVPGTVVTTNYFAINAPVNIAGIKVVDETGNRVVWSYPSESERLRLITTTNVLNTGTHWEAANPAVAARIDSQIDLRGVVSDYTVAVDFEAALLVGGQAQQLAGQGASIAGQVAICSLGYFVSGGGVPQLQLAHELVGDRYTFAVALPTTLIGRHIACARIAVGASSTTFSLFLDSELLGIISPSIKPTGVAYATYTNYAIGDSRNSTWPSIFGDVYAAALFNRALSDSQINLLSH